MTDQQPHTPDTEQVRLDYIQASEGDRVDPEEAGPQFDRWLATVEAAAEQRGAARGWDDGCKAGLDTGLTIGEVVMGLKPRPIPAPRRTHTAPIRRVTMSDLPGYYMPHCTNCYATSHSVHNCPYNDEEADHVD